MMVALIFIAVLTAFPVSTVADGGAGLVLVPLLRLIVPIASVPAALSIGTAASALSRIAMLRQSIRWDVVQRFVPTACLQRQSGHGFSPGSSPPVSNC